MRMMIIFLSTQALVKSSSSGSSDDFYEDMSKGKLPDSSYAIIKVVEIDMYRMNGEIKKSTNPENYWNGRIE